MTQQEPRVSAGDYRTVLFETEGKVATVTLNRPEVMNAFNQAMVDEFRQLWGRVRADDHIHVVVLRAAGEGAFSTGMNVKERIEFSDIPWSAQDPGEGLSPKQNKVWKPVIAAVHGMVAGGAFYWLNDCDIIISADDATFFDPHVSYGLTAALEPIGLARRIPLGEALRWALLGLDERMSARGEAVRCRPGHGPRHLGNPWTGPRDRSGHRMALHQNRKPTRQGRGVARDGREAHMDPSLAAFSLPQGVSYILCGLLPAAQRRPPLSCGGP